MPPSTDGVTLNSEQLNETDAGVLDLLGEGRASPRYLASELGKQQPYINQRLKRLVEHGHVRRVDRGLYELRNDPGSRNSLGYREKAIREYGRKCQVCGDEENIVVHHRDGDRGNDNIENLIPLCESCHGKVHGRSPEVSDLVRELGEETRPEDTTTISVDEQVADELARRKGRGDTYNDVLRRTLNLGATEPEKVETATATARGRGEQFPDDPQDTGERIDLARKRVHDLDLPGGDDLQQRREAAVLELYEELMSEPGEVVATTELKETLEHTGGYASVDSFWKNCVVGSGDRDNALATLPGVDELGNGRYVYNPLEEDNNA